MLFADIPSKLSWTATCLQRLHRWLEAYRPKMADAERTEQLHLHPTTSKNGYSTAKNSHFSRTFRSTFQRWRNILPHSAEVRINLLKDEPIQQTSRNSLFLTQEIEGYPARLISSISGHWSIITCAAPKPTSTSKKCMSLGPLGLSFTEGDQVSLSVLQIFSPYRIYTLKNTRRPHTCSDKPLNVLSSHSPFAPPPPPQKKALSAAMKCPHDLPFMTLPSLTATDFTQRNYRQCRVIWTEKVN